ncbi:MAG: Hsp20/alpha crystallin family protein [Acidimicrobiia bacterium]
MELKVWTPFFDVDKEWRLFDFPRFIGEGHEFAFRPSIDIARHDGELIVIVELPGIDPEKDVEISIDDDVLSIKGEKSAETEFSEDNRYIHERGYGRFQRRIPLPVGVDPDKVAAVYDKGVLTVRVSLPEEKTTEAHHIPIEVKAS